MKEYVTYKIVQRQRSARARVNAHTCANCAVNIVIKHKIITLCNVSNAIKLQNVNKSGMFVPLCDTPNQIANYALQNIKKIHFIPQIFAHVKKMQYFCTAFHK